MKTKVFVEDFPRINGEIDDTNRIQRALKYASTLKQGSNEIGRSIYYENKVNVVFASDFYTTSAPITYFKGITLESDGHTIFLATTSNKTIDCFIGLNVSYSFEARNMTFVGYRKALTISTGDVDVSVVKLEDVFFHKCYIGVDTVSFEDCRSTLFSFENCRSWGTDIFTINYCDKMVIETSWLYHTGYGGAHIINHGNLVIDSSLAVPLQGGDSRWIDNYEDNIGQQGLFCENTRFGGEGGGLPIVFNYASYDNNMARNQGNVISFNNCQLSSAGGSRDSNIVLFDMPNRISITNSFGFFDMTNGFVSCDESFNPNKIPLSDMDYISINLDHSVYQSTNFPKVDSRLKRFLTDNKPKPPSNEKNHHTQLSTQTSTITVGKSEVIYRLGLTNQYPNGLLSLYLTIGKQGTHQVDRKRVDLYIKNNSTYNQISAFGNVKETILYQCNDTPVDCSISFKIVNNLLEVIITSGSYAVNCVIKGEVNLTYLASGGRSVFEN